MKNITQSILLGLIASFSMANSAIAVSFNWTGGGGYSATGSFDYNNLVNDDFVRSSDNELDNNFQVTFFDNNNAQLVTYTLAQLLGESNFNFNYQISTGQILQSGAPNSSTGFSIGKNPLGTSGYVLESSSPIFLTDNSDGSILDSGGTVNATGVPFEFSPSLGFIISGVLFGGLSVIKRFYKK